MKIALLHYASPPVVGGVESVLGHHARLMADDGHQVRIVAARGAQVDGRIPFVGLPLLDSRHPEVLAVKAELDRGSLPAAFDPLAARILADLAPAVAGVDWLIAHNVCSLNKNLPLTAALQKLHRSAPGSRLILWHHDLAWTTPRYRAELHDGFPWDLLRSDWPGAVQVTISALRQRELADLLGVPAGRIQVVPNGVDAARFLKLEDLTRRFVAELDLLAAAPLVLLPVRITPRKNIELALRVLAALQPDYPAARLVVTGPLGPHNPDNLRYFEKLTALRQELGLSGAAHFLAELHDEFLPDEVISDFYALADLLLFPSREEGFGIPVLEAGLAGIPALCADIPPLRELGGAQVTYFSPDADPREVAGLIAARLARDPVYALRSRVRTGFTWERIYARQIAALLLGGG
ncbi:MAG: glycosyltransferase family 4 protein [Anaerolineales bacterium]|nr:glycosyltransferase family 4 protein [Anaerolineales bacterium]